MPICDKPQLAEGSKSATEVDDHASEAAKVKRNREQAYFNSYDFDAIEVLPYDEEQNVGAEVSSNCRQIQQATQSSQSHYANNNNNNNTTTSNTTSSSNELGTKPTKYFRTLPLPLSGNNRQRLQKTSLSSKSNSSGHSSAGSSRSSSGSYSHSKYAYLQRLGAFFTGSHSGNPQVQANASEVDSSQSGHNECAAVACNAAMPPREIIVVLRNGDAAEHDENNGNFVLPRAMLKYQSVDSSNSMPPATISVAHSVVDATNNNRGDKSAVFMSTGRSNTLNPHNTTRLSFLNENGSKTGFLTPTDQVSSSASESASATKTKTVVGSKKESISSTMPTVALAAGGIHRNTNLSKTKATTATPNTATESAPSALGSQSANRGRTSSHQSHYSTDKSGSSGYYSSNVCSTYSIEDHIYCEPVLDILDLNRKSKSVVVSGTADNTAIVRAKQPQPQHQQQQVNKATTLSGRVEQSDTMNSSRNRDMNGVGQSKRFGNCEGDAEEDTDETDGEKTTQRVKLRYKDVPSSQNFTDSLRILETSIENLDRHLKNFPSLNSQERIASFMQSHYTHLQHVEIGEKLRVYNHLPTIMEGYDPSTQSSPWQKDIADDTLLDIDLDSFLLVSEPKDSKHSKSAKSPIAAKGIDNPSFLRDELEENNYKCAKYINSCPEDAYRVESDIVAGTASEKSTSVDNFVKRYEDQLHFQNTRELLEDVRDKIRLLSQSSGELHSSSDGSQVHVALQDEEMPQELESMIKTLKHELESYLSRMNQHSELEIRQLCTGLVKNQQIVKMKNAFERRRSFVSLGGLESEYDFSTYEAIRDGGGPVSASGVPFNIRQQIASIRCASDPNFKMKRKSLTEVFPVVDYCVESVNENSQHSSRGTRENVAPKTQLQQNLAFHKPILNQMDAKVGPSGIGPGGRLNGGSGAESGGDSADKDSILEWHRKKPSIWEMYYGTNRLNQSLLGKRNGMVVNSNQASLSYPSSRPESDFTLDLPRAEQLRIKMEKEKKFRQRCRYITTFLSLVFFLLTVMVVSLVLTRGKRMFGSMI